MCILDILTIIIKKIEFYLFSSNNMNIFKIVIYLLNATNLKFSCLNIKFMIS